MVLCSVPISAQCKQFVHYDGRTFSVSEGKFPHFTLPGFGTERKQVQAAAALTQQLDLIQYQNCTLVKTLPHDSEEYARAILGMIQANQQLEQQLAVLQAYADNKSNQHAEELVKQSSVALVKSSQFQSTPVAYSENAKQIVAQIPGASQALTDSSLERHQSAREILKSLYSDNDLSFIRGQLASMISILAKRTGSNETDFSAYIFVPGGDGNLYVPPGMVVDKSNPSHTESDMRIPYWYGVAGVVFQDSSDTPACVDLTSSVEIRAGHENDPQTKKARMLLLPPRYNRVSEKFILGVPITGDEDQPVAVLTLSVSASAHVSSDDELCGAFSQVSTDAGKINRFIAERLQFPRGSAQARMSPGK